MVGAEKYVLKIGMNREKMERSTFNSLLLVIYSHRVPGEVKTLNYYSGIIVKRWTPSEKIKENEKKKNSVQE